MQNSASILIYLRPTRLVYMRAIGPYEDTIPAAWNRLFTWLSAYGYKHPVGCGYGLAHDNPGVVGEANCRYDACVALVPTMAQATLRDVGLGVLPGGPYACQRLQGSYDKVRTFISTAHSQMVPVDGLEVDAGRPIVTAYMDNPARLPECDLRADVCMPVIAIEKPTLGLTPALAS